MAIGWFTVLKSVPWEAVIGNAPLVAEGARKLWKAVGAESTPDGMPEPDDPSVDASDPLPAQVAELRAAAERLEQQMLASSGLIKALADQNTQLIARVEANQARTAWLGRACIGLALIAGAALTVALFALQRG
jgi:hypothetical protein